MKVNVSLIDYESDIVLVHKTIDVPDEEFVNKYVRKLTNENEEIVRIYNTDKECLVYISKKHQTFL